MPLTPSDVAGKQFGRQVRGYVMEEVDAFLDEVEQELSRLLTENSRLAQRSAPPPAAPPPPTAPPSAVPEGVAHETQEAALRTLLMAQRTADQAVAEARAEAEQILGAARAKVAATEQDLSARIQQAMSQLEAEQRDTRARVEELKAFEREYRLRLKAYLEGQLRELDSRSGGEGVGAGVPAAARSAAVGPTPAGVTDPGAARPVAPPAPAAAPSVAPPAASPAPPAASPAAPSGPPRQAPGGSLPSVGPFSVPANNPLEQVDEGPEPPAQP
ncbi:MAG TPA: DivIVA domain-containing protein [Mycobacteriales bacterium]|nr:DivIVA domain-containing protein [Mycobacteriales bacterium]